MIFKPSSIMLTIKISIIIILFISMFFFQKKNNPNNKLKFYGFGVSHNTSFKHLSKNSLFFTSMLKGLATLSVLPLLIKTTLKMPDSTISLFNWLPQKALFLKMEFRFDLKFNAFLSVALMVSWSMLEFSYYYMDNDPKSHKFFRLLIMFLLNMIILTSAKNLFLLFMGWEGVGFLSFLLMSWWTSRTKAKKSALQAVIYNRIGDMGILLFFSLSITLFKSWSLPEMFTIKTTKPLKSLLLIGALIAAAGKSAQFGLHPWLPAAMEGPTPVSALLHSSTMVVAGIFLLIRLSPMSYTKKFKTWCLMLGSMTAIFAATTAISQHDIKKIIAYSTTSQLGLMMVAVGLGQPEMALFHICTHAFFKAMLFLSSGSIIHSLKDEQDIRKMGGLHLLLPNTSACMVLGSLALSGIPFLAGFYSKDLILEMGLTKLSKALGIMLSLLATLLTSVYSLRIMFFCFMKKPTFSPMNPVSEEKANLTKALKRLAIGTIFTGWALSTLVLLSPIVTISSMLKTLALFITILGILFSISILKDLSLQSFPNSLLKTNCFTTKQWFYEKISHTLFLLSSFFLSLSLSTRKMDRGWSESIGAQGIATLSSESAQNYQLTQTGYMKQYILFSFLTLFVIMVLTMMTLKY